jgi:hypothetical protein
MLRVARCARKRVMPIAWEAISGASPRGRLCGAFVLGAALAVIGPDRLARGPQLCLISAVIRRPCPGCGMTRAASSLLQGDIRRAMRTNPRIVLVALVGGAILLDDLISVMQRHTR